MHRIGQMVCDGVRRVVHALIGPGGDGRDHAVSDLVEIRITIHRSRQSTAGRPDAVGL
ncbi:hypothetical protein [Streptomyces sp. NPDC046805]|uniref:hypothetical protein n=1 Tax=Streptomyces sp. NPDC046805 TaxID=3155134 RepID=UPI0033FE5DC9